jgi:hypothetical protein
MAKSVKFGKKSKKGGGDTSFNFGANRLSKKDRKAYRKKAGHGGGS